MTWNETYKKAGVNTITADQAFEIIDTTTDARINENLPHNSLMVTCRNAAAIIEIFLDQSPTSTTPDYLIQGKGTIVINPEDGIRFSLVTIKNDSGAAINAGDINYRISTSKQR